MANRKQRAAIANETLEIIERGEYESSSSSVVSVADSLSRARRGSKLYTPEALEQLSAELPEFTPRDALIEVANCTTFAGARDLLSRYPSSRPLALNFASAKNPGGGFLSGSQAQEEALARASGLYACLNECFGYYEVNRACKSALYTHHMIYSPEVPVFRDDRDVLVDDPMLVSIITAPAVNAGAVRDNEPSKVDKIAATMQQRIDGLLSIARHHGHPSLVLGAWGCGVFRNNPTEVARWFRHALFEDPRFAGAFEHIVFAVLDRSKEETTLNAFREVFDA